MSEHTPGPWVVKTSDGNGWSVDKPIEKNRALWINEEGLAGFSICYLIHHKGFEANARLIAAAPELLDTLKLWEPMIEALLPIIVIAHPDKLIKMREAYSHLATLIAKAEGQE